MHSKSSQYLKFETTEQNDIGRLCQNSLNSIWFMNYMIEVGKHFICHGLIRWSLSVFVSLLQAYNKSYRCHSPTSILSLNANITPSEFNVYTLRNLWICYLNFPPVLHTHMYLKISNCITKASCLRVKKIAERMSETIGMTRAR